MPLVRDVAACAYVARKADHVGLATNDLQFPPELIGPLTTLHEPHAAGAAG
jgi:hypothetical protein